MPSNINSKATLLFSLPPHHVTSTQPSMPTISILMPIYNCMPYLPEAMASMLEQTYADFELLAIEDGSTDGSREYLHSLKDPRIRIVQHTDEAGNPQNRGLIAALNTGLDAATSTYIARMDGDDISHPERLERQVTFMQANPDIDISSCGYRLFGDDNAIIINQPNHDILQARLLFNSALCHAAAIYRRDFLETHHIRYPNFTFAEDYAFWCICVQKGRLSNIPDILYDYRIHGNSVCQENWDRQQAVLRDIYQWMLKASYGLDITESQAMLHYRLGCRVPVTTLKEFSEITRWAFTLLTHIKIPTLRTIIIRNLLTCIFKTPYQKTWFGKISLKQLHHQLRGIRRGILHK